MKKIKALRDCIIFQFLENTDGGSFANKTSWGFEIKDAKKDLDVARWAKVIATGKKVDQVNVDDYILIEPLMWTLHIEIDKNKYWMTNESKVIFNTKNKPDIK